MPIINFADVIIHFYIITWIDKSAIFMNLRLLYSSTAFVHI